MKFEIKKAVREQRKLRAALCGPSGSGKTFTALTLATGLKGSGRIVLIDSEEASASLYADQFDFDTLQLPDHDINTYLQAIDAAEEAGADVIVIDSASHAWESILEKNDQATKRSKTGNSFQTWGDVGTPLYKSFLNRVLRAKCHVICTMRSKTDYVMEEYTDSNGKTRSKPVKVGLAPIFRQGGEYEFDVIANVDLNHNLSVEKTRINFLDGKVIHRPDHKLGLTIRDWLSSGATPTAKPKAEPTIDNILSAFARVGASQAMIEDMLGHRMAEITESETEELRRVLKLIMAGAKLSDFFLIDDKPTPGNSPRDQLRAKAANAAANIAKNEAI